MAICPISTPRLNEASAGTSALRGRPNSCGNRRAWSVFRGPSLASRSAASPRLREKAGALRPQPLEFTAESDRLAGGRDRGFEARLLQRRVNNELFLSEKRDVPAEMRLLPAKHTVGEAVIGFS